MSHWLDNGAINYGVIIPAYNNGRTLKSLIRATLSYTTRIIVVNDGSNDNTAELLREFKDKIQIISYAKNRGKGAALKKGLLKAGELGYEYVITLDADGQHDPAEIPKFLEALTPGEKVMMIGNRDMNGPHIPKKSIFGRKFSNFWVKLETGRELMDTQSGYRLYTVAAMNQFRFMTVKYDFELESLVRWVWRGYPVKIVDIAVYYPPPAERISHFKAFQDNLRLSLLNTVLVTIALVYIIPRGWWRSIRETLHEH